MKHLAVALIFSSGAICLAGQSPAPAGDICGHVLIADTHQPVAGATVVMASNGSKPPFPTQTTATDGSFCFSSLSPGQYTILAFKTGFVLLPRTPGTDYEYTMINAGKPVPALEFRMAPTLPVSSAAGAFNSMFTPEQRGSLDYRFDSAKFSPDGKYLAVALWLPVEGSEYGDAEQILRYDLMTHKLFAVTPGPATNPLPQFNEVVWNGDTLYAIGTQIDPGGAGKDAFFKAEGDVTTAIDSLPPDLKPPIESIPVRRQVGLYEVDGDVAEGISMQLSTGKTVITNSVYEDDWDTLDNPPAVFYGSRAIDVFYLMTRRRQISRVPNSDLSFLAVTKIPKGFRIAYSVLGKCGTDPRTLSPSFGILPATSTSVHEVNLCLVDIPDESRLGR